MSKSGLYFGMRNKIWSIELYVSYLCLVCVLVRMGKKNGRLSYFMSRSGLCFDTERNGQLS